MTELSCIFQSKSQVLANLTNFAHRPRQKAWAPGEEAEAGGKGRRQEAEAGGRRQILYAEEEAGGRGRMQMQDAEAGGRGRQKVKVQEESSRQSN